MPGADPTQDLFAEDLLPQGLKYQAGFIGLEEERSLLRQIERLPFREFEFHGFTGKRRTVSFGWRYDFNGGGLTKAEDMPKFLALIRARAEALAGIAQGQFQQVLVTEYGPGAGLAGTKTVPSLATSWASLFCPRAHSGCAGKEATAGNAAS